MIPKNSVMDDRLLCREFYNANEFPVTFTRQNEHCEYIIVAGKYAGPEKVIAKPGEWAFLPHAFYIATSPDNRPILGSFNFGKTMFKGVKPNREELRRARKLSK